MLAVENAFPWRHLVLAIRDRVFEAPALVLAQYVIHNAMALLFPAWVSVGRERPRGVDAMGQRLIMLGGTWAMLLLSIPVAYVAGVLRLEQLLVVVFLVGCMGSLFDAAYPAYVPSLVGVAKTVRSCWSIQR